MYCLCCGLGTVVGKQGTPDGMRKVRRGALGFCVTKL